MSLAFPLVDSIKLRVTHPHVPHISRVYEARRKRVLRPKKRKERKDRVKTGSRVSACGFGFPASCVRQLMYHSTAWIGKGTPVIRIYNYIRAYTPLLRVPVSSKLVSFKNYVHPRGFTACRPRASTFSHANYTLRELCGKQIFSPFQCLTVTQGHAYREERRVS